MFEKILEELIRKIAEEAENKLQNPRQLKVKLR